MPWFYRLFVTGLHLSIAAATAVDPQCESDAQSAPEVVTGSALLSKKFAVSHGVAGVEKTLLEQELTPAMTRTAELMDLSTSLTGHQLENMVNIMRTMRNENLQPVPGSAPVPVPAVPNRTAGSAQPNKTAAVPGPDDPPILAPVAPEVSAVNVTTPEEDEPVGQTHMLAKFIVVPLSFVFFLVYNLSTLLEKYEITAIPESIIVIAIGVVLGFFMKRYSHMDFFEDPEAWGELNTALLNLILLPIIIFSSGWALRRHDFFSQFPYILMFATIGTGISTCVIAGLINLTGQFGFHHITRWRTAFTFASLISATDPVATLSTYSKLKVEPLLNILVFGESTINDAVAIVLFKIFNGDELMLDPQTGEDLYIGPRLICNILWGIFKTFFGSLAFGVALGFGYTLIARGADMRQNKKGQILVIFVSCYLTYALAESIGLSGIIAETFCSIVMAVYMRPHLSTEGVFFTTFFLSQLATLADSAVFLLVGVSVVQLTPKGWSFGLWTMLFCIIARGCSVFPIALLVNGLKAARGTAMGIEQSGWNLLSPQHMFMMWHGGLRGGIALALAWELGKWVDVVEGPGTRYALQTATFLVILVFLVVFGGSTSILLKHMGIPCGTDEPEDHLSKTEYSGAVHTHLKWLDKNVLKPILVGDEEEEEHKKGREGDDADMVKMSMTLGRW